MDGQHARLSLALRFHTASPVLGRLLREHGPIERLLADPELINRAVPTTVRPRPLAQWPAFLAREGWRLIAFGDADYPPLLATLPDAPGMLFVQGDASLLQAPQLALVGARGASPDGLRSARQLSSDLAAMGFVVTSGLALGIDAAAHEGALHNGRTLAVMASGPDTIYPARHRALAQRIVAAGGALVTEYPPGVPPARAHFPLRNRIISGLSLGTVVIEAALRSGSLITARLAAEQGRAVFAVPGSVHNPLSQGCHRLLRDGALWLESIDDVLEEFSQFQALAAATATEQPRSTAPPSDDGLLVHFGSGVNSLDELQARSGLPVDQLSARLAQLEIEGAVVRLAGGYARSG